MQWKNYNYIVGTVVLFLFLFVPFGLKLKDQKLEAYPAIIMPSGASIIKKGDSVNYWTYEMYAKKNGSLERMSIKEFLDPIPEWYVNHISLSNFGLKAYTEEFKLYKPPVKFINYNRFSEVELPSTKRRYRERLATLGFDDSVFMYRRYKIQAKDTARRKYLKREDIYQLK